MIEITILLVMLLAGIAVGLYLRGREGTVRPATLDKDTDERAELLAAAGITGSGPAVLHFSAEWCGPCTAVRRVVAGVTEDLADSPQPPRDIEVDIDADPTLAKALNVMSLPTTFVFDAEGRERFRISGVPQVGDLRSALTPLTV
ncbi:thioredoxin family protein [Nocardia cyriacigeorgica]|uniref:thioredoxin family protein n=1 Tax=Nocardia cyriacigeorgica TaxID=135487 RepID=UPI000CE9BCDE|nr:thioredoxin family protein [Nocardia cyriacigeorgica]MBF6087316.1 thioredoxin family protein [Nocardia cyriacigeorgica]MBF6092754.1 thioredoxin family protein [Nocardia cyriacigeorgica]MBF6099669.1 thioredoxin family protein [Nocardia cyriacigeorgica]MBF6325469.1 thioredoxin family protein [Nocardia cyriacigeorgica]PPJ01603.1 thioredoxin [Nocardia cyriacigeorgica]